MPIIVTFNGHEVSIILASDLLGDVQEDDWALISHADHTEDRQNNEEHRAERQAELTVVTADALAGLLDEEAKLLAASHAEAIIILLIFLTGKKAV